jgi:hypothetical protein
MTSVPIAILNALLNIGAQKAQLIRKMRQQV